MSTAENKAVFLSYASQDAEAAKRIAEALRAAGVEVWFDQSELVGGDQWDQKIRGQVKSCTLFVPVISANTQSRLEGYFRLEWKLAAQRTHTMADAKPFLLPVVIDATRDAEAHVPEEFRAVQWTRLRQGFGGQARLSDGEALEKFCERVKHLLAGEVAPVSDRRSVAALEVNAGQRPALLPNPALASWLLPTIGAIAASVAVAIWQPWKKSGSMPAAQNAQASAATAAPPTDAQQLVARALAISDKLSYTRVELATAEEMATRATELERGSAPAWGAVAWIQATYLQRAWDLSLKRRQDTETAARLALALDADQPDALNALAQVMLVQGLPAEAERFARQALRVRPYHRRSEGLLASALGGQGRSDEQRAILTERLQRDPGDVLAHYELAQISNPALALEHLDAALAVAPFASALSAKARLFARKGDLAGMRSALGELEKLPVFERAEDGPLYTAMWGALLERKPERVLAAAALTTRPYLEHGTISSPKAWQTAMARVLGGQDALARVEWQAAESALRARLREQPDAQLEQAQLAVTLVWFGKTDEAAALIAPLEAVARETRNIRLNRTLALYYAAEADAARAAPYLRVCLAAPVTLVTDHTLLLDPWWDKLRGQPEFEALLAEAKARITAAGLGDAKADSRAVAPDPKSVAVLAFDNLSDDKANEYFSDGISEELLNALAKVPGLRVAARTSAFYFKGRHATAQEIGQKLGMAHLVDGTVRKEGNAVRVVAHLSRTDTGEQIWTAAFDGTLDKPWALQEKIAGQIAQALQVRLGATAQAARSVNPEAYAFVLEGRYFWNQRADQPEDALAKAADAFQRALALAPDFAEAHAGLGDVWVTRGLYRSMDGRGASVAGDYTQAKAEAQRALALNPALAEPHVTLGYVAYCERQFADAEQHYARAFAANPNYALAYHWHAILLSAVGRVDESLRELDRSIRLDPLSSNTLWSLTVTDLNRGRLAEALAASDRALALRPGLVPAHSDRALILLKLGRKDEAIAEARTVGRDLTVEPRWWADSGAIYVLRQAGLAAEAADYAKRVLAIFSADDYRRAFVLAALGRFDEALPAMGAIPTIALTRVYWHPMWDPFRDDPRFRQLLVRLGCVGEYNVAREARAQTIGQRTPEAKQ